MMKKLVLDNRKVPLPEDTIDLYNNLYQHGDHKAILALIEDKTINQMHISRALKNGEGLSVVIDAIIKYYNQVVKLNSIYEN